MEAGLPVRSLGAQPARSDPRRPRQDAPNLEKLDVERLVESLDKTLKSASKALDRLSELDVKGISSGATEVLDDASAAIHEVEALATDARTTLASMRLGGVGENANRLINDLDARLGVLLDRLSAIDVRALNDTLAGTREAARNLNEVIEDLKRYPSASCSAARLRRRRGCRRRRSDGVRQRRSGSPRARGGLRHRGLRLEAASRRAVVHARPSRRTARRSTGRAP